MCEWRSNAEAYDEEEGVGAAELLVPPLPVKLGPVAAAAAADDGDDDGTEEEEAIADSSKVGRSRISLSRSTFRASKSTRFRRSSSSFSSLVRLYRLENATA